MQPIDEGIVPASLFEKTCKLVSLAIRPSDEGSDPDMLLELSDKAVKLDMKPIEYESFPVIPFVLRSIAVTSPEVHVTPVHAGEHTSLRGVLPEQRHPVRPVIVQRFVD